MKTKKSQETASPDYSLFKSFICNLPNNDLYQLRNIITNQIHQKRHGYRIRNENHRKYSGDDSSDNRIEHILREDWSELFCGSYDGRNDYYVYAHIDPLAVYKSHKGYVFGRPITIVKPIYIGMGVDGRYTNFKRSNLHQKKLSSLMEHGFSKTDIAYKICTGLTIGQAQELESKLILLFGCLGSGGDAIRSFYGEPPCLYNAQYEPYPLDWDDIACSHSIKVGVE